MSDGSASEGELEVIDVDGEEYKERCDKAKMPRDLPEHLHGLWLKFCEADAPVCVFHPATLDTPSGFYLKFNKNDMLTYAGLLQLKYKAPELYTVCNMAGCLKETKLTTTLGGKVKANFGNTLSHILSCSKFKLLSPFDHGYGRKPMAGTRRTAGTPRAWWVPSTARRCPRATWSASPTGPRAKRAGRSCTTARV